MYLSSQHRPNATNRGRSKLSVEVTAGGKENSLNIDVLCKNKSLPPLYVPVLSWSGLTDSHMVIFVCGYYVKKATLDFTSNTFTPDLDVSTLQTPKSRNKG